MEKKKQIEEMAKIMCGGCIENETMTCSFTPQEIPCDFAKNFAEALYKAVYRKINENEVVLTREELERHKGFSREEVDEISETAIKNSRKETAEKFAERLKDYVIDDFSEYDYGYLCMKIDAICKEITEGK